MPKFTISFALFLITFAVNVAMPLFRPMAAAAGLNNGQTALVLSFYIAGMLPCYVLLGGISDRLGRKPVLIFSLFCAFVSNLLLTISPNIEALIVARVLQGVGLALSMGTGTAYLAEVLRHQPDSATQAANAAARATSIGFGGGPFVTTLVLVICFTFKPITLPIATLLTAAGLLLCLRLPNLPPVGGALVRLPYFPTGSGIVNTAIGICWGATSVVIAVVPTQMAKFDLQAYAGLCPALIAGTGAIIQPYIRRRFDPNFSIKLGFALAPLGFGITIWGCALGFLPLLLFGTFLIGTAAYGFTYQGGLAIISNLGGQQRARAVSGFMFVGYVGFGLPPVVVGYLADWLGIINGLLLFEIAIILLSFWLFLRFKELKL